MEFVFLISHAGTYLLFRNTTYWDIRQQNMQRPSCSADMSLLCQSRRHVLYTNPIYWVHRVLENAEIMGYQAAKSATSVLFSSRSLCTGPSEPRGGHLDLGRCINPIQTSEVNYACHIFTHSLGFSDLPTVLM